LPEQRPVVLNPAEHRRSCWLPVTDAIDRVSSWTNREALERLVKDRGTSAGETAG
jgi:hypothetical protein